MQYNNLTKIIALNFPVSLPQKNAKFWQIIEFTTKHKMFS